MNDNNHEVEKIEPTHNINVNEETLNNRMNETKKLRPTRTKTQRDQLK